MNRWVKRLFATTCVMLTCLLPAPATAQGARGRLLVTVIDTTGAVLPDATVRIVGLEPATSVAAIAPVKAAAAGVATLTNLVPGRYAIEAEFPGFIKGVVKETRIRSGDNRQTITLALTGLTDSVEVGRDREEAASDRGVSFGTAITREQIDALSDDPDELRQQLMEMGGAGAVISVDSFEGAQLPPKSQIRSIRIARDQFAAENHNAGIGRIEIVTQPGIGPLRGNVGSSFYDSALDGANPLVSQRGPAQNQSINASLSGTLIKDKMSFGVSVSGGSGYQTPVLFRRGDTGESVAFNSSLTQPADNLSVFAQADYALSRDQTLRFYFNRFTNDRRNLGIGTYDQIERAYSNENSSDGFYVQHTGPLARRFAINSRLQYSSNSNEMTSAFELPTVVVVEELGTGGAQQRGGTRTRALSLASDLDYVRGMHSFRVGVLIDAFRFRSDSTSNYLGTYTFENRAAFDEGRPRSYTRRIGDPNIRYQNVQAGVYIQDDIRVSRNLTFSPGLRYEAQTHVPDRLNFGPRFGVTWAPFKSGRTTLRSSVGVFYDWLNTGTYQQTLQVDGFRQQEINLFNPSYPDPGEVSAAAPTNRYLLGDDMKMPRTLRVSLGVAHTFNARFSVGTIYADARGTALLVGQNLNAPVDGLRPDSQFANVIEAVSQGRSRQRTLNTNFTVNLAGQGMPSPTGGNLFEWRRGLRLTAGHTLARFQNNTDGAFATPATNDLEAEWGTAQGDIRHRFNVSVGTNAVRSLNASLNMSVNSAAPLTIRTGKDNNGDLIFNDRPDGVGRNTARTDGQFNSSAFVSYSIPLGQRSITSAGGVSITSQGGGLVVNNMGMQTIPRYRLVLGLNIQNLTNHANYFGYNGVDGSLRFLQPTSAAGVRRITFNAAVTF